MNREIKFRAWDNKTKIMYKVSEVIFHAHSQTVKGWDGNTKTIELYDPILMQYSGRNDSDRNEIYEGDIMYVAGQGNSYVKYFEDVACLGLITNNEQIEMFCTDYEKDITMKVIGNVYQNKDLIK